jgi:hypothetical protein
MVPCDLRHFFIFLILLLVSACGDGTTSGGTLLLSATQNVEFLAVGDGTQDLAVSKEIHVAPGKTYRYKNVNIYNGGKLIFDDVASEAQTQSWADSTFYRIMQLFGAAQAKTETHFRAKSILVENEGALIAGTEDSPFQSILVFHLYGSNTDNEGITCKTSDTSHKYYCGVPADKWAEHDDFFHYEQLPDESLSNSGVAFFGRKVLAVSYGGTLQLFGAKGATKGPITDADTASGKSWARLAVTVKPDVNPKTVTLDRIVDWEQGDQIVVTTTDFLPGHSEQREIESISASGGRSVITLTSGLTYRHNGEAYDLTQYNLSKQGIAKKTVETRAAVALLTRNIRIESAGKTVDAALPAGDSPDTDRYFGGHTVIRQGFTKVQIQGVEFKQMGQGGMLARSPLQFLGVYGAPNDTFVRDCSIHDSMTRWIELRGAQNLLLERNVGYKSIGHGYMSAGYEANNTYRANIGIYARPALKYPGNPRNVPGVYAQTISEKAWTGPTDPPPAPQGPPAWCSATDGKDMSKHSDYVTPAVFLIANPYNTYEHNMAVGAGACGSCYWIVPAQATGPPETAPDGYISAMQNSAHAPLLSFKGNFCSTAQYSLLTIGGITTCGGVTTNSSYTSCKDTGTGEQVAYPLLVPVKNSIDHALNVNTASNYVPKLTTGNCVKGDTAGCSVTVIEGYTSSFHWGQQNWSAIWLRNNWFLFNDGALTDILGPGLTMVSGGSYEQVMNGYWALTRKTVFVGQTQEGNDFATAAGPKVDTNTRKSTGLTCQGKQGAYCLFSDQGISIPTDNFLNYQRFFNIYDGPVYQDSNAYLNIKAMKVTYDNGDSIYGVKPLDCDRGLGIPYAKEDGKYGDYKKGDSILTNAAIAWKQPNGFYYPPAFHSSNLAFHDVDLRHFVLIPLFQFGTQITDAVEVQKQYRSFSGDIFNSFTDVDRQTELNDDDGSMSGIKGVSDNGSISLNKDTFYHVPKMTYQCASEQSCLQAPYDHVTLNVFPKCLSSNPDSNCPDCSSKPGDGKQCQWDLSCGNQGCNGIPLYRQYLNTDELNPDKKQMMRMLGQGMGQRVNLVANNGKYYIDTTQPSGAMPDKDRSANQQNNFEAGRTYYVYLLYAKAETKVTIQVFVGKNANDVLGSIKMVRLGTKKNDGHVITPPFEFNAQSTWPWDQAKYTPSTGILEVMMDMSRSGFAQDFIDGAKEACKPSSVCEWKDDHCGCAATAKDIDYKCEDAVCRWSSKAMECPSGGCIGFQFTLPSTFVADGADHRPLAEPFPDSWNMDWKPFLVDEATAGSCHYSSDPLDPR